MQLLMRRPEIEGFISIAAMANRYDFTFLAPCPSSGLFVHGSRGPGRAGPRGHAGDREGEDPEGRHHRAPDGGRRQPLLRRQGRRADPDRRHLPRQAPRPEGRGGAETEPYDGGSVEGSSTADAPSARLQDHIVATRHDRAVHGSMSISATGRRRHLQHPEDAPVATMSWIHEAPWPRSTRSRRAGNRSMPNAGTHATFDALTWSPMARARAEQRSPGCRLLGRRTPREPIVPCGPHAGTDIHARAMRALAIVRAAIDLRRRSASAIDAFGRLPP